MRRRGIVLVLLVLATAAALAYLRDPPWLIDETTGLRPWQRAADGRRARWSGGHASFFVPSNVRALRVPIATTFDDTEPGGDRPMLVSFSIDDRRAGRTVLTGPGWQDVTLALPAPGTRRVRRIDLRTSVTRTDNRGVQIGEVEVTTDGQNWRLCCFPDR